MTTDLDDIKMDIADTKEKLKDAEKRGDFTRRDRLESIKKETITHEPGSKEMTELDEVKNDIS